MKHFMSMQAYYFQTSENNFSLRVKYLSLMCVHASTVYSMLDILTKKTPEFNSGVQRWLVWKSIRFNSALCFAYNLALCEQNISLLLLPSHFHCSAHAQ